MVPPTARGLRAGAVVLRPGEVMDWHSTHAREELLIALAGCAQLEVQLAPRRTRRVTLKAGVCAFLPCEMVHRVVNRSPRVTRYLYVTASVASRRKEVAK